MKILCTCSQGENRSVTFAHILRYVKGFDVMTLGLETNTPETQEMMFHWADVIIVPEDLLLVLIPDEYRSKVKLYDIGEDVYPRPFNRELYRKVKAALDADHVA